MNVLRTKSIEQSLRDTDEPEHKLKRDLSAWDLTVFGIGVIIGTGIFVLTGIQAGVNAGPAIVLSFLLAGITCGLAALCYAEFASTVPVAGSAYTFSYATFGELVAWIIGWDLALELGLGVAVVARGWSGYLQSLFDLPDWMAGSEATPDLGAIFIVLALTTLAVIGTKLSGRVTAVLVVIKVAVVLFVIVAGLFLVKAANYAPFIPPATPAEGEGGGKATLISAIFGVTPSHFGVAGVIAAASVVFFAFIGFDIVATAAEETKNPQRDLPRGILGSLIICTLLYMAVAAVITGMVEYGSLASSSAPLADAFDQRGIGWAANLISLGGICGITTVILVLLLGQARVFFAMSRDGLLPRVLSKTHPRFGTPYVITIVTGSICAVLAGFVPLEELADLVSIGTLFAFVLVSAGVIILRRTRPDLPRAFKVPGYPVVPVLAVLACLYLMLNLTVNTWIRFVVWMAIGFAIYFAYGQRNSRLGRAEAAGDTSQSGGRATIR